MGLARGLTIAAALLALPGTMAAQPRAIRPVTEADRQAAREGLARFTRPTLTQFGSEAEFRRYVEAASELDRTRSSYYYASLAGRRFAQAAAVPPNLPITRYDVRRDCEPAPGLPCLTTNIDSLSAEPSDILPDDRTSSITHWRPRGVQEGDIVMRIGRHLLVLQHSRLFVVDLWAGDGRRLALTDRVDVYRSLDSAVRYKRMLVFGDRVLVTGSSRAGGGTEIAMFRLGAGGRLAREGVFRILSNDDRGVNANAVRLIGDRLVIHIALDVKQIARADYQMPVVRRWRAQDDVGDATGGAPLLDPARVYRPVANVEDPVIHSISVCPLGDAAERGCRTTAFAGPARVEWLVTDSQALLWTGGDEGAPYEPDCRPHATFAPADFSPAYLYNVPLSGGAPGLIGVRGFPPDLFAMHVDGARLHVLAHMRPRACFERVDEPALVNFVTIRLSGFGPRLADAPAAAYVNLPPVDSEWIASQFTDTYLVYGGLSRYYGGFADLPEDDGNRRVATTVHVVPIARPSAHRPVVLGHTLIRLERAGEGILLTGNRDRDGLIVSLIAPGRRPRLASSLRLAGRYESEGRSHGFGGLTGEDGNGLTGLVGLPTVPRVADSERGYWRSRTANLDFLSIDARGRLAAIGTLERRFAYADYDAVGEQDPDGVPGYECEVSCIDWYGSSRPIFADGRIFALSGAELIEGRIARGRIRKVQRLNIALSRPPG